MFVIRLALRLIGILLLLLAFVALVLDGVAILATGDVAFKIAGATWTEIAPTTLNQAQFAIQEHLGLVWFWEVVIQWILLQPTFIVLGVAGLIFCFLGRRPKPRTRGFAA